MVRSLPCGVLFVCVLLAFAPVSAGALVYRSSTVRLPAFGGTATTAWGLRVDAQGEVFALAGEDVYRFSPSLKPIGVVRVGVCDPTGCPRAFAIDERGKSYVARRSSPDVQVFDAAGNAIAVWRGAVTPPLASMASAAGRVFISDGSGLKTFRQSDGALLRQISGPAAIGLPFMQADPLGRVYASERTAGNNEIWRYVNGRVDRRVRSVVDQAAQQAEPSGAGSVAPIGPSGRIWVAEPDLGRLVEFDQHNKPIDVCSRPSSISQLTLLSATPTGTLYIANGETIAQYIAAMNTGARPCPTGASVAGPARVRASLGARTLRLEFTLRSGNPAARHAVLRIFRRGRHTWNQIFRRSIPLGTTGRFSRSLRTPALHAGRYRLSIRPSFDVAHEAVTTLQTFMIRPRNRPRGK